MVIENIDISPSQSLAERDRCALPRGRITVLMAPNAVSSGVLVEGAKGAFAPPHAPYVRKWLYSVFAVSYK